MMGFGYGMGGWGGGIGSLLILVILVIGVIYLWRTLEGGRRDRTTHGPDSAAPQEDSALRILRERYARGEIDREEYDRRKEGLR